MYVSARVCAWAFFPFFLFSACVYVTEGVTARTDGQWLGYNETFSVPFIHCCGQIRVVGESRQAAITASSSAARKAVQDIL